jgi:hypothetical protein
LPTVRWLTARHLFLLAYFDYATASPPDNLATTQFPGQPSTQTLLERSEDGGASWSRADLAPGASEGEGPFAVTYAIQGQSGDRLLGMVTSNPSPQRNTPVTEVWRSMSAGETWQRSGTIAERDASLVSNGTGDAPQVFAVSNPDSLPAEGAAQLFWQRPDGAWTRLPPLPVPHASRDQTGVFRAVGTTGDGRLLVLGTDPVAGVNGPAHAAPVTLAARPRLWAWDPRSQWWVVSREPLPCMDLTTCNLYKMGMSHGVGPDGSAQGWWLWLVDFTPVDAIQFYRSFLPAS